MEKITANGLAKISFHGDVKENAVAMVMEDSAGQKFALAITAQTVSALLPPLLGLAKEWSGRDDLDLQKVTGSQNTLPANRIEFANGRAENEIAIRLFVGEIELSFVMPVEELFGKLGDLAKRVKRAAETAQ